MNIGDTQIAGGGSRVGHIARFAFAVGIVSHLTGLFIYDRFPYLYFFSVVCLLVGYYVRIGMKGYQPLVTPSFYGMVFLLSLPVIGPIAGFQQIWAMPRAGEEMGKEKKRLTTLISLGFFVIFLIVVVLMIPSLTAERWIAHLLLGILAIAVIAVSLAMLKAKRTKGSEGGHRAS